MIKFSGYYNSDNSTKTYKCSLCPTVNAWDPSRGGACFVAGTQRTKQQWMASQASAAQSGTGAGQNAAAPAPAPAHQAAGAQLGAGPGQNAAGPHDLTMANLVGALAQSGTGAGQNAAAPAPAHQAAGAQLEAGPGQNAAGLAALAERLAPMLASEFQRRGLNLHQQAPVTPQQPLVSSVVRQQRLPAYSRFPPLVPLTFSMAHISHQQAPVTPRRTSPRNQETSSERPS